MSARFSRRRLLAGSIASAVATAASASPQGWVKLRLAGRPREGVLPLTQTITFGAKTPVGYGGHPLGYRGPDATSTSRHWLGITGGNGAGHWQVDGRNHLVPKNGTTAYGKPPPVLTEGPSAYVLNIAEYADQALTKPTGSATTVTIDVIPYAAHAREMTTTPGGVNQDNFGDQSYQLNKLLTVTSGNPIQLGDTIYLRDGAINPRAATARLKYPSNGWTIGEGDAVRPLPRNKTEPCIKITSDNPDTTSTNPDGHKKWGGGGKIGPIRIETSADVHYPLFFQYVSFTWLQSSGRGGTGVDKLLGWTQSSMGYGLSVQYCYFGAGPNVPIDDYYNSWGLQTHKDYVVDNCYFERCGSAMQTYQNGKVTWNTMCNIVSDGIQFGALAYELQVTDNFEYAKAAGLWPGVHSDGVQFNWGSSTPTGTYRFGIIARNISEHATALVNNNGSQGLFMNPVGAPTGASVRMNDAVIVNNIYHEDHQNLLQFVWMDHPIVRFNIALHANSGQATQDGFFAQHPNYEPSTDGDFSLNVANVYYQLSLIKGNPVLGPQMGAPNLSSSNVTSNIPGVPKDDDVYRKAFNFPPGGDAQIRTRAQAIAAWTPIRGGPAMHPDGRYYGALLPVDDHGVVSWNNGKVFDPTAVHTPLDPRYFTS
jgi:hypothetical protein